MLAASGSREDTEPLDEWLASARSMSVAVSTALRCGGDATAFDELADRVHEFLISPTTDPRAKSELLSSLYGMCARATPHDTIATIAFKRKLLADSRWDMFDDRQPLAVNRIAPIYRDDRTTAGAARRLAIDAYCRRQVREQRPDVAKVSDFGTLLVTARYNGYPEDLCAYIAEAILADCRTLYADGERDRRVVQWLARRGTDAERRDICAYSFEAFSRARTRAERLIAAKLIEILASEMPE
jgi:hypothetical protein